MKRLLPIILLFPLLAGFSPVTGPTDLGNEAYKRGDYAEALKHYRDAAEARPDSPEAHYNLGNAYYKTGEYDRALGEYREAARLDPEMADAYYNAGDSLFRMKRYEEALKSYDRAKGEYGEADPDTEHNIEVTKRLVEKEKEKQRQQNGQDNNKGREKSGGRRDRPGAGGQEKSGQGGRNSQGSGPPPMSNEELKALMDRQADEEKRLRNYFRPGETKDGRGREDELKQMLRGMGFGPAERRGRPGEPFVERDW